MLLALARAGVPHTTAVPAAVQADPVQRLVSSRATAPGRRRSVRGAASACAPATAGAAPMPATRCRTTTTPPSTRCWAGRLGSGGSTGSSRRTIAPSRGSRLFAGPMRRSSWSPCTAPRVASGRPSSSSAWRRIGSRTGARWWTPPDLQRAVEEERRLAYVALTRATRRLILAYDPARPSRFLAEMGIGATGRPPARPP